MLRQEETASKEDPDNTSTVSLQSEQSVSLRASPSAMTSLEFERLNQNKPMTGADFTLLNYANALQDPLRKVMAPILMKSDPLSISMLARTNRFFRRVVTSEMIGHAKQAWLSEHTGQALCEIFFRHFKYVDIRQKTKFFDKVLRNEELMKKIIERAQQFCDVDRMEMQQSVDAFYNGIITAVVEVCDLRMEHYKSWSDEGFVADILAAQPVGQAPHVYHHEYRRYQPASFGKFEREVIKGLEACINVLKNIESQFSSPVLKLTEQRIIGLHNRVRAVTAKTLTPLVVGIFCNNTNDPHTLLQHNRYKENSFSFSLLRVKIDRCVVIRYYLREGKIEARDHFKWCTDKEYDSIGANFEKPDGNAAQTLLNKINKRFF